MRNLIPFKVCKRHLFILFLGIIALNQALFGSIAGATQFEYISGKESYIFPIINNAINYEATVSLGSILLASELYADPPSDPPVASFSTNVSSGNAPLTVQFNDISKNANKWNWVFGDGGTSTLQNPVHTFLKAGNYTVALTASNTNGTNLTTKTILVKLLPEASFRTNVSSGNAPLTIQFNDTSKYATGWSWVFGDGGTSTEQNPMHTYSKAGNYTVTLTARNENGSSTATTFILAKLLPEASFRTNVSSGNAPLTVQFNDTSKYATNWNWVFGDGITSTEQSPVYTYAQSGNYTVTFTVSNENGTSSSNTTILAKLLPEANFSMNVTSGNPPLTVQFNDSSNYATGWSWVFGDGGTSTQQNPVYTYLKSGNYTVAIKASNENGSSSSNTTILVKVLPTADFKANVSKGNAPLSVQFTDLSQNAELRSWDFTSDGTSDSSDLNPVYVYTTSGTYNATLTVSNANGTASKNTTITVSKASISSTSSISGSTSSTSSSSKTASSSKSKSITTGSSTQSVNTTQNSTKNITNATNTTNTTNTSNVSQNTTDSKKSPGFETFFGTASLIAVFTYRRRK